MSEVTPAAPVAETAAPVAAAVETPVAAVETAPVVESVVEAKPADSILAPPAADAAPVAVVEAKEAAPVDPSAAVAEAVAEAPLPTYEELALPDGVTISDPERFGERLSTFDNKIGDLERKYGIDHEAAQAFRDEAAGLAIQEITRVMQQSQEAIAAAQAEPQRQLDERKQTWRTAFEDSDLAGNRRQTTLDHAEAAIREYAGDEKELRAALQETGMANNPAMIRLLSSVGAALVEGRMVAASRPAAAPKTKATKFYGN